MTNTRSDSAKQAGTSTLSIALDFLGAHPQWFLFPITRLEKDPPLIKGNLKLASSDPKQITAWHERWRGCNWGLALRKSGVIVMDVDTKPGKVGAATLDDLELEFGSLPETLTVRTPSGGLHYYFEGQHRFGLGKHGFGPDIDSPNYVLIPGCTLGGATYMRNSRRDYVVINDAQIAPAPTWFGEFLREKAQTEAAPEEPAVELDQEANVLAMTRYLQEGAPPCIQNRNGNKTLFDQACFLKDNGISESMAVELLKTHYNKPVPYDSVTGEPIGPGCDPLWSVGVGADRDRLDVVVHNAYQYAKENQPGAGTAEAQFAGDEIDDDELDKMRDGWKERDRKRRERNEKADKDSNTSSTFDGMIFLDADKIKVRNINFVWPLRLARGKHTCLAGEGGKGKSQIAYDTIARITTGAAWPDKSGKAPLGRVIILSAEDGPDDVMVPRLIAAGANLKHIKIVKATVTNTELGDKIERKFNLQDDLEKLRAAIEALNKMDGPPVTLILFDPVSSYMGGSVDSFRNTQVRHVLDPITNLAEDVQCAILSITHFNKGTTAKAVNRVMDSAAFVNAPRASFGVFDDIEDIGSDFDETRRFLFLAMKTNIGKFAPGLKYHIEEATGGTAEDGKPVITSKIVWDGTTNATADQVAQAEQEQGRGEPRLREAMEFLRDELADGPKPVADVQEAAEAAAIAPDTLKRAKRKLRVKATQVKGQGPGAGWVWGFTTDDDGNVEIDRRGDGSSPRP